MHFVIQLPAFLTDVPTIHHPWDLQHRHLPELFTPFQVALRDRGYQGFCKACTRVSVASQWIKGDIVTQYAISADKIDVVPMGSIIDSYEVTDAIALRKKYGLPDAFLFYPGQ